MVKLPKPSLKLAVLLGIAMVSTAFEGKNTQAQTFINQQSSTIQLRTIPATTSLQTSQKYLSHPEMRLGAIPLSQPPVFAQVTGGNRILWILFLLGGMTIVTVIAVTASGIVVIKENEVGIIRKKFAPLGRSLPPGQRIALNGEAGWQAQTLTTGIHFHYWFWLYEIRRQPIIRIAPEQIGLVVANDGLPIPKERMLGKAVDCKDFQDGYAFLNYKGERGRQLAILTAGDYGINTELFTLITAANATEHGMDPNMLQVYKVDSGKIGIVETLDGISTNEVAGPIIAGHNGFQDAQKFIDGGGYKGLQEEVITAGAWNLNPWFVRVKQVPLTEIPPATVGVVISSVGKTPKNGASHDPVEEGYKGTLKEPLYPRTHIINTEVKQVVIVPTDEISLDWSNRPKPVINYDSQLHALKLRSKDSESFNIEVTQVIQIDGKDAPRMISHVGSPTTREQQLLVGNPSDPTSTIKYISIKNLVIKVLASMVSAAFYKAVQNYKALEFHAERSQIQQEAKDHIEKELKKYGVKAVGTFIKEIDLPPHIEGQIQRDESRKREQEMLENEILLEKKRQQLVYEQALTEIQKELVKYQYGVQIAQLKAKAQKYEDLAKADATREEGKAHAEIIQAIINVIGRDGYLDQEKIKQLVNLKLPDVWVDNSDGNGLGTLQALIASILNPSSQQHFPNSLNGKQPSELPKPEPVKPPQTLH